MSRFLFVDDNVAFAENVAEIVGDSGHTAVVADSGERALELLQRERFDALVTDMRMPGLNGAQLMARARELDPALPVIVVTAYSGADDLESVSRAGVLGVLPKPVPIGRLVELLVNARRNGVVAVVDDDRALVENFCELLREHGYAPVAATSLAEAASLLTDVPLFAAVVDLRLPPGPDGEALRLLVRRFPTLPIVVATGYPDSPETTGARCTLEKPVDPATLLQTLDQLHGTAA